MCTFGGISANAFPDDELPLPQHCPDHVSWATAELDNFPGERHLLPKRALWTVVIDSLSEPHLHGEKGRGQTTKDDSNTVKWGKRVFSSFDTNAAHELNK